MLLCTQVNCYITKFLFLWSKQGNIFMDRLVREKLSFLFVIKYGIIRLKGLSNMKIYNTLSHQVEEFIPYEEGKVKMYTCGPTVYNYAHIGNLRTYIFEDILEKTLRYLGYEVLRCMNITDVGHLTSDSDSGEDKMVKGAKKENKTVLEIAKF